MARDFSTTRMLVSSKPESGPNDQRDQFSANELQGGLFRQGGFKNTNPEFPLVSVLTIERDAGSGLEDTIESVLNQDYPNVEYIIIDGASKNETLDRIRKYDHCIDFWISQPDTGFYNGLNKAIGMANGDLIHVLNADDLYIDRRTISRFVAAFQKTNADLIYCDTLVLNREEAKGWIRYSQLTRFHLANSGFAQQSFFYRKKLFDRIGLFDDDFTIAADYEFLLRAVLRHKVPKVYLNAPLIIFARGGMSATPHPEEKMKALSRYYSRFELWLFTRKWFQKCFNDVDCIYRIGPLEWLVRKIFHLWTSTV
jgi:glycosyltransferase involved in cell wall biosynthesis